MLGLAGTVVFWPAVIIGGILANLVVGSAGLEARVKARVLEAVQEGLRKAPMGASATIDAETERVLEPIQTHVMQEVLTVIEAEERNLQAMAELNKRSRVEKVQTLAALDAARRTVAAQRRLLRGVLNRVQDE
jgi:hypothetical protein